MLSPLKSGPMNPISERIVSSTLLAVNSGINTDACRQSKAHQVWHLDLRKHRRRR